MTMLVPGKKPAGLVSAFNMQEVRRIYNTLTMLAYLTQQIDPDTQWPARLKSLILASPFINSKAMVFPAHWQALSVWEESPLE